jgi:hypothetical protein
MSVELDNVEPKQIDKAESNPENILIDLVNLEMSDDTKIEEEPIIEIPIQDQLLLQASESLSKCAEDQGKKLFEDLKKFSKNLIEISQKLRGASRTDESVIIRNSTLIELSFALFKAGKIYEHVGTRSFKNQMYLDKIECQKKEEDEFIKQVREHKHKEGIALNNLNDALAVLKTQLDNVHNA